MQDMTAGEYARQARQVLAEIKSRAAFAHRGWGHWTVSCEPCWKDFSPGPQRSEELRERLRERAAQRARRIFTAFCSGSILRPPRTIHANDLPKLIRAVEVCLASRQKMSDLWQQGRDPLRGFRILRVGLDPDRSRLYERINQRAQQMFESGLIEETQKLIDKYG